MERHLVTDGGPSGRHEDSGAHEVERESCAVRARQGHSSYRRGVPPPRLVWDSERLREMLAAQAISLAELRTMFESNDILSPGLDNQRPRLKAWCDEVANILRQAFEPSDELVNEWLGATHYPIFTSNASMTTIREGHASVLENADVRLASLIRRIDTFESSHRDAQPRESRRGERIFIVHGHNEERLTEVEHAVMKVTSRDIVVLRDRPDGGRTVIEKLVDEFVDVGYAIVLMTGDDLGRLRDVGVDGDLTMRPRARQNVVLELGYAVAALGRSRVMVLRDVDLESPSDFAGVVYTSFDDAWRDKLRKELQHAGIPLRPGA
jgi:predicted nucleotide-binding protein